jgi:hypothetical protein
MASSIPSIKIALKGTIEPVDIQITDESGQPVDASSLTLSIVDQYGSSILWSDDIDDVETNIVKPSGTIGYYYYPFGVITSDDDVNGQTDTGTGDYLFQWTVLVAGSPITTIVQNVKVLPTVVMYNMPYLRLLLDKARKMVDPAQQINLGYTDAQLVMYLEQGLTMINAAQPESVGFTLDNFPYAMFRHIANESALVAGTISQQLFAIDTDLPGYSDQGISMVITHAPQLAAFLNSITQRLDKEVMSMKRQYVSTGGIHMTAGPNYRLSSIISAAPQGSLFRNIYYVG